MPEKKKKEGLIDRLPIIPMRKTPVLDRLRGKKEEADEPLSEEKSLEERSNELLKRTSKKAGVVPGPKGQRPGPKKVKGPYYNVAVPAEGPEPGESPEHLEPDAIEYAGVKWATETAKGISDKYGKTPQEREKIYKNILPVLLEKREKWEESTAKGIADFIGITVGELKAHLAKRFRPQSEIMIGNTVLPKANPKLATLTPEEDAYWNYAFPFYINEGMTEAAAGQKTWKEMQEKFPRLTEYEGARAETPIPKKRGRPKKETKADEGPTYGDDDLDTLIDRARDGKATKEHGELDYGSYYLFLDTGLKNTPFAIIDETPGRLEWSIMRYKTREAALKAWEKEHKRFLKYQSRMVE